VPEIQSDRLKQMVAFVVTQQLKYSIKEIRDNRGRTTKYQYLLGIATTGGDLFYFTACIFKVHQHSFQNPG